MNKDEQFTYYKKNDRIIVNGNEVNFDCLCFITGLLIGEVR